MGFLSDALGLKNNAQAGIVEKPATMEQAAEQYRNAQSGLAQQQAFINALQAQNGIQNQSDVYKQFQQVASGQGPNPAQAMLANATGANTSNQAALMAGQRGAGANPALIARMAAQQGAANQQNAAGQAAQIQAQQSLGALNSAAGIAGQQVGNHANAITGYNQAAQGEQANILNQINAQNNAALGQSSINAGVSGQNQQMQGQLVGGAISGASSAAAGSAKAHGGVIEAPKAYAYGGVTSGPSSAAGQYLAGLSASNNNAMQSGLSNLGAGIGRLNSPGKPDSSPAASEQAAPTDSDWAAFAGAPGTTMADRNASMMGVGGGAMARGGAVKALLSPGERYLSPKDAKKVAAGKESPMKAGVKVPGHAKVKGDSLKNDTVHAELEAGGIVIPRSVMNSKDPAKNAAKFVAAHMASQNIKKRK